MAVKWLPFTGWRWSHRRLPHMCTLRSLASRSHGALKRLYHVPIRQSLWLWITQDSLQLYSERHPFFHSNATFSMKRYWVFNDCVSLVIPNSNSKFKTVNWLTKEHRFYLLHMCKIQHKHKSQRHEVMIWYTWWRHTAYTTLYITSLRLCNVNHTENNKTSLRSYIFPHFIQIAYIFTTNIQYWIRELHA